MNRVLRNLRAGFSDNPDAPPPSDEKLWAYALDALEPWESAEVAARIAASPQGEKKLQSIRGAIQQAGAHPGGLELAKQVSFSAARELAAGLAKRAAQKLREFGMALDGFFIVAGESARAIAAEPEFALREAAGSWGGAGEAASSLASASVARGEAVIRVEISTSGGADLVVILPAGIKSEPRCFKLELASGSLHEAPIDLASEAEGRALRIRHCPAGFYKFIFPNLGPIVIALEHLPPPS